MISTEELMTIQILHKQGYSKRAIARQLGVSRNTVDKHLSQNAAEPSYHSRPEIAHKLDPFNKHAAYLLVVT
jgi:transposase